MRIPITGDTHECIAVELGRGRSLQVTGHPRDHIFPDVILNRRTFGVLRTVSPHFRLSLRKLLVPWHRFDDRLDSRGRDRLRFERFPYIFSSVADRRRHHLSDLLLCQLYLGLYNGPRSASVTVRVATPESPRQVHGNGPSESVARATYGRAQVRVKVFLVQLTATALNVRLGPPVTAGATGHTLYVYVCGGS